MSDSKANTIAGETAFRSLAPRSTELDRLRALNAELVKALTLAKDEVSHYPDCYCHSCTCALEIINAALAKASA